MRNFKKIIIFLLFLTLLIYVPGCKSNKDVKKSIEELNVGTRGIVINFLPNNPPSTIHADQKQFDVVLELNNKGIYPTEDISQTFGKVYLSGYDSNILNVEQKSFDFKPVELQGKSLINLNGGSQLVTFKVTNIVNLNVEKYEPTLLATVCYNYITVAGPSVCIDPDPYSTVQQKKVCEVKDIALSSQGAPIAITKIEEEAFALKTQFKITIKNVGGGDVIKPKSGASSITNCDPFGTNKIGREDIDKVYLEEVSVGQKQLECWPFAEGNVKAQTGVVRLINTEGSIICELTKDTAGYSGGNTPYTTPLKIRLSYAYRSTAQRNIQIKQEPGSLARVNPTAQQAPATPP